MPEPRSIKIDLAKQFEHLARAPIVEAVIQCVARAEAAQTSEGLKTDLKDALPEYSTVKSLGILSVTLPVVPPGNGPSGPAEPPKPESAWHGFRLETADARNVAAFTREPQTRRIPPNTSIGSPIPPAISLEPGFFTVTTWRCPGTRTL